MTDETVFPDPAVLLQADLAQIHTLLREAARIAVSSDYNIERRTVMMATAARLLAAATAGTAALARLKAGGSETRHRLIVERTGGDTPKKKTKTTP